MATEITIPPKPFTYADGTPAVAGQVNDNFDKVFDENFTVAGYTYFGWWRFGNGLEYNDSNAFQSVSDVDLTTILQEGDKIRWFHDPTNTQKYGWVSHVDYDDTVANRSYVEVIGDTVLDETVELDGIGVSRIANPFGWPQDPLFGAVAYESSSFASQASPTSGTFYKMDSSANVTVPRGRWIRSINSSVRGVRVDNGAIAQRITLSTTTTSETISRMTRRARVNNDTELELPMYVDQVVTLTTSATYHLLYSVDVTIMSSISSRYREVLFMPAYK
jgi:hypothetical protein